MLFKQLDDVLETDDDDDDDNKTAELKHRYSMSITVHLTKKTTNLLA